MNNLKKTLKQQGITQTSFAKVMGCSKQAVNYWVNGKTMPSTKRMKNISEYLKVSIEKLFFKD